MTIRERDSMEQVRIPISHVSSILASLVNETSTWANVSAKYPVVTAASEGDGEEPAKVTKTEEQVKPLIIDNQRRAMFSRPAIPIL